MILTLLLLDIIYSLIFKFPLNSIFYLLLVGSGLTRVFFVLLAMILDIYFNKIFILPLVIILLLISVFFQKQKNNFQKCIFLAIYFLIIFICLNKISMMSILCGLINIIIYFLIIREHKLNIN